MKKLLMASAVLVLLIGLMPLSALAQLRYNLEIGNKYGLKQLSEQDIQQSIQGMTQSIKNTMGGDVTVTIKSKDGDVYTSEFIFETLFFKMESPMFSMAYDSSDEAAEENMMSKAFSAVVGFPFEVKFNDKGEIIEVNGFEKLVAKMSENSGAQGSAKAMQESLKGQFSDESMKHNLGSMLIIYPEGKTKKGTTWQSKIENKGMMASVTEMNYEIASMDNNTVVINGAGTMKTDSDNVMEQNGMTQRFDMGGDFTSTVTVNAKTGWPINVDQNSAIEGNVTMESPQLPNPMEIPMSITTKTKFSEL